MRKKRDFQVYTGMWLAAILILMILLWQNVGDARIINYSGLVRGATQKLVKEELNGQQDDTLIAYLDGVIYDLQTGDGNYDLMKNNNEEYQNQLSDLKLVWEELKKEIPLVRSGAVSTERLYELSGQHFEKADRLVSYAEEDSNDKLIRFIIFYGCSLIVSVSVFALVNKRNQKALEKSVEIDSLTGLLSRYGFETEAAHWLRQHSKAEHVIIEFDIDNFKMINDVCGYILGDQLLRGLTAAISNWKEHKHLCARIDADDFVLLAEQSDTLIPDFQKMLKKAVQKQVFLEPFGGVSFTFGAYQIKDNGELIKTIMDKANTARKTAKAHEYKSFIWYDEQLLQKLRQENRYREQMHHGIEQEEFKLYLQPKVALHDMTVVGAEALVRWDLPGSGLVYPDAYIPLFEKNGSIADLDFYMLKKTCMLLRRRKDEGKPLFAISVNFSRVTLYQPAFREKLLEIVDRFAIPHSCIEVEVTESAFNEVADMVLQTLTCLKDDGFIISMDDFGAGYSNLNLLGSLPIQTIKLDRAFLKELDRNERMKGIIACVVELAHTMDIKIVCEGVEKLEHVAFLREIGCDYAQGYYFSKPVPQDEFLQKYQILRISSELS